ncbi:hypothetical protein POPTR_006G066750v4 [Populus trichocarpa]|jgi:hypothetical protein|uniref:Uncharacterized protein n=1 Tax=Populus trichocarpa TaxID=3694 RepID=A0ACC0SSQ9_POPTR|nr:hypothetical protein POPTR_006G066750v4 [Populus trichocarpa]
MPDSLLMFSKNVVFFFLKCFLLCVEKLIGEAIEHFVASHDCFREANKMVKIDLDFYDQ